MYRSHKAIATLPYMKPKVIVPLTKDPKKTDTHHAKREAVPQGKEYTAMKSIPMQWASYFIYYF
jgi:hypothetical protein